MTSLEQCGINQIMLETPFCLNHGMIIISIIMSITVISVIIIAVIIIMIIISISMFYHYRWGRRFLRRNRIPRSRKPRSFESEF